jgi:hypothetical protein
VSAGAAAISFEEKALLAHAEEKKAPVPETPAPGKMPTGQLGELTVSRLICGGNLISSIAHSRDLVYVSSLLRNYFTDEKVLETFELAEKHGVNTAILRLDDHTLRLINQYWREKRGEMQWIAQVKPRETDLTTDIKRAVDGGATGVYIQGETGDRFVKNNRVDMLVKAFEYIEKMGVVAGIGAHLVEVLKACKKANLHPDFFMKTFNAKSYWSAGCPERHDSVWEETPQETAEFMKTCETPWIAFKVLGAGAIPPAEGFRYAFENGADFICVGMFDFQVAEDARIVRELLGNNLQRTRPWKA